MISRKKANDIKSLKKKKPREEKGLYVIEGDKLVREYLEAGINVRFLIARPEFLKSLPAEIISKVDDIEYASFEELKSISTLKTPHNALAVIPIEYNEPDSEEILKGLTVALDFVQDPGNLGTIIRAAAWFGLKNIICSEDCVDVYNPKVIQASMGALLHVRIYYTGLSGFMRSAQELQLPVFGTMPEGESIYDHQLAERGVIVLGNESKGISEDLLPLVSDKIMIPGISKAVPGIESLNVGMAASVVFSEFSRRGYLNKSPK